jgi:hypothetical protein
MTVETAVRILIRGMKLMIALFEKALKGEPI